MNFRLRLPGLPATVLASALTVLATLITLPAAQAQTANSTGTTRIVVPYPPGQGADLIMRLMAEPLGKRLGQPVIVDNRPGAGGTIGTEYVSKQPADGSTLLMGSSGAISIAPTLTPQAARYNPLKDFEPLTGVAAVAQVFVVSAKSPHKDLAGFLQAARKDPGKLSFASSGNGSTQHLFMAAFAHDAGIRMLHVPYKGAAPAFNDLMGGQVDIMSDTTAAILPQIKAGKVVALGVTSAARQPQLPEVPTLAEQGVKNFSAEGWITVLAPPGMAAPLADRLDREMRASLADPAVARKIREMGFVEMRESRAELRKFIAAELARWKSVIDAAHITAE